jgi:aryl-alcohol dehydrogenase-like predicted oxidoreductase
LQTDHLDLYYFHCDDRSVPLADQLGAMHELVQEGKVRFIGASNFKAWRLAEAAGVSAANNITAFSCVQQRYTYLRPRVDADFGFQKSCNDDLLEYCKERDFQLVAYSPLLGGAYIREDRKIQGQYRHTDSDARKETLFEVALEVGATPNQVILAWLTGRGVVTISGASKAEQLNESLIGFDLTLSEDILDRLDAAGAPRE